MKRFGVRIDLFSSLANGSEGREVEHKGSDVRSWNFLADAVCGELQSLRVVTGDNHQASVFRDRASGVEADPVPRSSSDKD